MPDKCNTVYKKIDPNSPDQNLIDEAGRILREGGLVAFPTETVYGLGANAMKPDAAAKIYKAKGRPSDNPLIVHIADVNQVSDLAEDITAQAQRVMEAFWPGPLTVILPKKHEVPDEVTAGLNTVAIRMPDHPVALAIIKSAGVTVAAPSANSSGKPSPTRAEHVLQDLNGKINMIVDAGPCKVGLESTVLDLSVENPVILRPGAITREDLESVLGHLNADSLSQVSNKSTPKAPGMKYRHYSPEAPVVVVTGKEHDKIKNKVSQLIQEFKAEQKRIGILAPGETINFYEADAKYEVGQRSIPETVAQNLFYGLRFLDEQDIDVIIAEGYLEEGIGRAVMNRLSKAAREVINV